MPLQVDLGRFVLPDIIDKFIHHTDPLIEIGILYRITIVGFTIVVYIGTKKISHHGTFIPSYTDIHLHAFGVYFPPRTRYLKPFLQPGPRRIEQEGNTVL